VKTFPKAAGITERFAHGRRRTLNDMLRPAKAEPVIAKALTGHVTAQMREHYSTVGQLRFVEAAAVASVPRLFAAARVRTPVANAGRVPAPSRDGAPASKLASAPRDLP
jgi:hypothetical protein